MGARGVEDTRRAQPVNSTKHGSQRLTETEVAITDIGELCMSVAGHWHVCCDSQLGVSV